MRKSIVITTLLFSIFFIGIISAQNITECMTISEGGEYILQNDISNISGTCFTIQANEITLDLNNYSIQGDDSGYGVLVQIGNYNVIKGGRISDFETGVLFVNSVVHLGLTNVSNLFAEKLYTEIFPPIPDMFFAAVTNNVPWSNDSFIWNV